MSPLFGLLLLFVFLLPVARGVWLWLELFRITASGGKLTLKRGRLPQALFAELSDIAKRHKLDDLLIRAVVEGGQPRLVLKGNQANAVAQPMRNVLGRFTLAQLRSGKLRN